MAYGLQEALADMMGSMFEPIIVAPGGWMEVMPSWLRHQVEMDRMRLVMEASKANKRPEMATDAEAMIYISSTSHLGPIPSDWAQIQLWLGRKVMGDRFPQAKDLDIPAKLNTDQQRNLDDLKRWIWTRRLAHRRSRG